MLCIDGLPWALPKAEIDAAPLALSTYVKRHFRLAQGAAAWAAAGSTIGKPSLLVSPRIRYTPKKQTDAAGNVLNRINKRAIDFHFDRRRGRRH